VVCRDVAQVTDASRSDAEIDAAEAKGEQMVRVLQDTRLDNRVLDLRVRLPGE